MNLEQRVLILCGSISVLINPYDVLHIRAQPPHNNLYEIMARFGSSAVVLRRDIANPADCHATGRKQQVYPQH